MFTGIVELMGTVRGVQDRGGGRILRVEVGPVASECAAGASVAIDGVCLTVVSPGAREVSFDVVQETLGRSTLGSKRVGDAVNVERSLRVGDRLDGHFVQGHVDGQARVERVIADASEHRVWFRGDAGLDRYLVPKGSVALDGVSLTIAELRDDTFSVALIPTTLQRTTLGRLRAGDRVNVETDVIVRTIVHRLNAVGDKGVTLAMLQETGFA